jgi:antitoxin (DNA-binding transcriptional repressor) of toxin-antitoxin stability system
MMKVFTYSEARQRLAELLDLARSEDVEIRRRDGSVFVLSARTRENRSPLDIPGIQSRATTDDIIEAVRESRRPR